MKHSISKVNKAVC